MKPQFTVEAFADWCEKQPADASYNYGDARACACAQYAKYLGIEYSVHDNDMDPEGSFWDRAEWHACPGYDEESTFHALAARLRAAQ